MEQSSLTVTPLQVVRMMAAVANGGYLVMPHLAADANNDGELSISDALYIINYRLQPGSTNFALYSAPEGPYPECGRVEEVTIEECPEGSHVCFPAP